MLKNVLKWIGIVVAVLLALALAGYGYASYQAGARLSQTYEPHEVDFPVPWPLTGEESAELKEERPEADPQKVAHERAVARGEHLVEARYVCSECHGEDFGGGTMIDSPVIGTILGPNITTGEGSVTTDYTIADWDRIVRHGLKPDGTPTLMPSEDFVDMTDRELSDIIAYLRSRPPVDNEVPPVDLGPMGTVLVANGSFIVTAENVDHHEEHRELPPEESDTKAFGKHLAQVCTGCHGKEFRGGPIPGGDPSWAPATNLTPHEQGIADYSFGDFDEAMRQGTKPNGEKVKPPMDDMMPYAKKMTDTEMRALFAYLQSLPARPPAK